MSDAADLLKRHLDEMPVIAILRGLAPADAAWVGDTIISAGIRILEVPLNSPGALHSIGQLASAYDGHALIGAGTVLRVEEVTSVGNAGGRLIVSPNTHAGVIRQTHESGLVSCPGCLTPTEAFEAIDAGGDALKVFPASVIGAAGIRALKAVLPVSACLLAVGGVTADNMSEFRVAGVSGFGIGASLFAPGIERAELAKRAAALVAAAREQGP